MDSGVLYLIVAFAGVWGVLIGYGAHLRRRARHAAAALAAGEAGPGSPGDGAGDPPVG